jgi:hypothetical protein
MEVNFPFLQNMNQAQAFYDVVENKNSKNFTLSGLELNLPELNFHRRGQRIQVTVAGKTVCTTISQLNAFQWAFNHSVM